MPYSKAKKAASPTGKPSKVKPAAKKFLAGKKTAGKKTSAYSGQVKKKKILSRSTAAKMDRGEIIRAKKKK